MAEVKTQPTVTVTEEGFTDVDVRLDRMVTYMDHHPGDATRYEIAVVDVGGRLHLGALGYVSQDAVLVVCGMAGKGTAMLIRRGDDLAEFYVAEKLRLDNPHTVHHITELIARAIDGRVVGCPHEVRGVDSAPMNEDAVLDLADDLPSTFGDEPLMDPRD